MKNTQISDMSERVRESNILMDGLRNLVLQLQPGRWTQAEQKPAQPLEWPDNGGDGLNA